MKIIISNHAKERFIERWNLGGDVKIMANEAWSNGKQLPEGLKNTITKLGFSLDGYWTAYNKVFGNFVWVFQPVEGGYILSTLFPLGFLKHRRKIMLKHAFKRLCLK